MVAVAVERITVSVVAADALSRARVAAQLRGSSALWVVDAQSDRADVAVVVADAAAPSASATVRRLRAAGVGRVVVVATTLDDAGLLGAVEAGACAVLRRRETTPERLSGAVVSAAAGLTEREAAVLRLIAEGWDTATVANRLCYSERTVKGTLHGVTTRLQLRNRSHAVAYAIRHGLI